MAQNLIINGVTYNSVTSLSIPKAAGGSAVFPDTSDADAAEGDIATGKTAYVNGSKLTGTATGGGGSAPVAVAPKDVNFYDYDGTCLFAYTIAEAQALSALPTQPTHTGLTGQGWNYTLAQVNALTNKCNIGATYITDDGKTRLYIRLDKRLAVPLYWSQTVANGVTVDWGDGSNTETFTGTGYKNATHTYSTGGEYCITLDVTSGTMGLGNGTISAALIGGSTRYRTVLYNARIGSGVTSIGITAFDNCYSLQSMTIPSGVTSIGDFAFCECYSLQSMTIPSGVTSIGDDAFSYCNSLQSMTIPSSVTSIGNGAFSCCAFMKEYHFQRTTPPMLGGSSVFGSIPSDCIIYVPSASLSAYKDASKWSAHASKMVGE